MHGAESDRREADWISRVVTHDDHDAYARLVRLHQSAVRQLLRRLTRGDAARADDLAQDVFFKAYRSIAGYRGEGRFISWLLKIAYQTFLSECGKWQDGFVALDDEPEQAAPADSVAQEQDFDRLLDSLREQERTALLLHYRHDLNHVEAAEAMAIPLGSVKSLIRRAREKLIARYRLTAVED